MKLSGKYETDRDALDMALNTARSFDIIKREFTDLNGRKCVLYAIDGLVKDTVLTDSINFFMRFCEDDTYKKAGVPYIETEAIDESEKISDAVMKGGTAILREKNTTALVMYARSYPLRSVEEPEADKVMRGSRDGFGESIILNTSLMRRRIRDNRMCTEKFTVGSATKTDVALCYMDGLCDKKFLSDLQNKIKSIDTDSLNMGAESLAEVLIKRRWYNPFPKIRYTERPDTACAHLLEGSIILICDNYPAVMILPTSIFDFAQETDDYYFPPLVGSYLRISRIIIVILTIYLLPWWYLWQRNSSLVPDFLSFVLIENDAKIPLIAQIFLAEFAIDGLKLAAVNTPDMLGNSLSVVAGLILSDFAVAAGWLTPAVILYVAISTIGNFTQVSYELGYALKFMRLLLLLFTALFGLWGFVAASLINKILITTNRGVGGRGYLYPLIPFNATALKRLIFRVKKQ